MYKNNIKSMISNLGCNDTKLYLTLTGGGLSLFGDITEQTGASRFFLGGNIPYMKPTNSICRANSIEYAYSINKLPSNLCTVSHLDNGGKLCLVSGTFVMSTGQDEREGRKHGGFINRISLSLCDDKIVMCCRDFSLNMYSKYRREQERNIVSSMIYAIFGKQTLTNTDNYSFKEFGNRNATVSRNKFNPSTDLNSIISYMKAI